MGKAWPRPERLLVEAIERSQPARKELAEDYALGEAVDRAEPEPGGELVQAFAHEPLVAGIQHGQPVAHHDPIHSSTVDHAAVTTGIAYHLRIMALAGHREGRRIDRAEH